ncbi:MAG: hypothetical protein QM805_07660 [Pseudomonas sp.]
MDNWSSNLSPFGGWHTSGGTKTPAEQIKDMLSGTSGFVLDPTDLATMWTTSAKTTPVASPNDPVGSFLSSLGNTPYTWQQTVAEARPTWDGAGGLIYDGTDDGLVNASNPCFNGASVGFFAVSIRTDPVLSARQVGYFSSGLNVNVGRVDISYNSTGRLLPVIRRDDAIAGVSYQSANGAILPDAQNNIILAMDFTGTNTLTAWVNGVQVISTAMTDSTGPCSSTNSQRMSFAAGSHKGKIGRVTAGPVLPSAAQRSAINDWLGQVPL